MNTRLQTPAIEFIVNPDSALEEQPARSLPAWLRHFIRHDHQPQSNGHRDRGQRPRPPVVYPAEIIGRSGYPLYPADAGQSVA